MQASPKSWLLTPAGVSWTSLGANVSLAVAKIAAGVVFASQTIFADGIHSASDLVTDVAVLAGLGVARKPADSGHPYGHRRVSTMVALFIAAALFAVAAGIAYHAARSLHDFIEGTRKPIVRADLPFWLAAATIPVKEIMFRLTRYVGNLSMDRSLLANAWHHRTDAFSSIAAAIGLAGVLIGGANWAFLDPVFAIMLSMFLVVAAWRIGADAAGELVDRAPADELLLKIRKAVAQTPGVRDFHAFRARQLGGKIEMDIHVLVDPGISVHDGHEIATLVKRHVMQLGPAVVGVIVHVEPYEEPEIRRQ